MKKEYISVAGKSAHILVGHVFPLGESSPAFCFAHK